MGAMIKNKTTITSLSVCFILLLNIIIPIASAIPILVEMIPEQWANLGYANKRTNFEYNGSIYQFYADQNAAWDGFCYEFSADGLSWSGTTYKINDVEPSASSGSMFAVWQNATYVFFVYKDSNGVAPNWWFKRGSIGTDGVITWGSEYKASAGVAGQYSSNVAITVTSDTLLPHIIFERGSGRIYEVRCATSDGSGAWTETTLQGTIHDYSKAPTIVQLSSNNIYAIWTYEWDIYGRLWNETAGLWDAAQNIYTGSYLVDELSLSATSNLSNDEIYLSFHGRAGWLDGIYFFQRDSNGAWSSRETINSGSLSHSVTTKCTSSLRTDNSTIYTFWDNADDLTIYFSYKNTSLTTWSVAANLTGTPTDINSEINSLYRFDTLLHGIVYEVDPDATNGYIYTYVHNTVLLAVSSSPEITAQWKMDSSVYYTPWSGIVFKGTYTFVCTKTQVQVNASYKYTFDHWSINGSGYYGSASINVTLGGNTNLTMHYLGSWLPSPYMPTFVHDAINGTLYMRSDTHTIHEVLGYKLDWVNTYTAASDSRSSSGTKSVSYGIRVWAYDKLGNIYELSGGTPEAIVTRSSDGDGYQTAWFECPAHPNLIDALQVNIYQRFDSEPWSLRRIFITADNLFISLPASSWKIYYYSNRTTASTTAYFFHGSATYCSRINLQYYKANPWEIALARMQVLDFIGWMFTPWTYYLGDLFWSLALLFAIVTAYNRFGSLKPILALLWLFGGVGSVLSAVIPALALPVAWIMLAVAMGLTLFQLLYK